MNDCGEVVLPLPTSPISSNGDKNVVLVLSTNFKRKAESELNLIFDIFSQSDQLSFAKFQLITSTITNKLIAQRAHMYVPTF